MNVAVGPVPGGWPEALTPYTPVELLALVVLAVLAAAYVLGVVVMLVAWVGAGVAEQRRATGPWPVRVAGVVAVVAVGILLAVLWPAGRLLEVVKVREAG